MAKSAPKTVLQDLSKFSKSTFTLTFTVELLGIDVWTPCNEGPLELGPCTQAMKLQYQLYHGHTFDIDILIWPHVAKIWCGAEYCWVRTWLFLERRWLTFSIRHAFPVRVSDLRSFIATVTPSMGLGALSNNAKNDKNTEVFLPPLSFAQRRYFANVKETLEDSLESFILNLIWKTVEAYIPASYLDGVFDVPQPVTDVRHQDAVLYEVQEIVLRQNEPEEPEEVIQEEEVPKPKIDRRESRVVKEKEKKKIPEVLKVKFEIKLPGDTILSHVGRIVPFDIVGDKPAELGEIIVLISTNNVPALDDLPIVFCNVGALSDIPIKQLKKARITQIYTRWILGEEVHNSPPQPIKNKTEIKFNDYHAVLLQRETASETVAIFLDDPYQIELRGIRTLLPSNMPKFFGYDKGDRDFGYSLPKMTSNQDTDVLIAVTKINSRALGHRLNTFLSGEYSLYPPDIFEKKLDRERICTNDINGIRTSLKPNFVIQPSVVLEAQMTLEVSMGYVGCKPQKMSVSYSRMYCLVTDADAIMTTIKCITEINESTATGQKEGLLTGFALDTGEVVFLYLEGPRDGHILQVWEMTEDFYPKMKPIFSSSAKYSTRLYSDLLTAAMPFSVMKMFVPLSALLACPPVYARPALPLPARSAVLKIGRIIASKPFAAPCRSEMPSSTELKSFRLELCVAPRSAPAIAECPSIRLGAQNPPPIYSSCQSVSRINWENNK